MARKFSSMNLLYTHFYISLSRFIKLWFIFFLRSLIWVMNWIGIQKSFLRIFVNFLLFLISLSSLSLHCAMLAPLSASGWPTTCYVIKENCAPRGSWTWRFDNALIGWSNDDSSGRENDKMVRENSEWERERWIEKINGGRKKNQSGRAIFDPSPLNFFSGDWARKYWPKKSLTALSALPIRRHPFI